VVTITSTFPLSSSVTRAGRRSAFPSANAGLMTIPALDVVQVAHRLDERPVPDTPCRQAPPNREDPYVVDLSSLLRLGGERRAECDGDSFLQKSAPIHRGFGGAGRGGRGR
jgi:hypothetical protein